MKLLYVTGTALVAARTALARPAAPLLSQIVRAAPGLAAGWLPPWIHDSQPLETIAVPQAPMQA